MKTAQVAWQKNIRTYIFTVTLEKEKGKWIALVPKLPGCNAWAATKEEVLAAIQENIHAYLETLVEDGLSIPVEAESLQLPLRVPAVAVMV